MSRRATRPAGCPALASLEPLDQVAVDELSDYLQREAVRTRESCLEFLGPFGKLGPQPLEALGGDWDRRDVGLRVHPVPPGERSGEACSPIG